MFGRDGLFPGAGSIHHPRARPGQDVKERTMRAIWNDKVLAESDDTVVVEGNHYFPADSLRREYFTPNNQQSVCPWKGTAS
jgi:uncharacterized protein (DUF427 family)